VKLSKSSSLINDDDGELEEMSDGGDSRVVPESSDGFGKRKDDAKGQFGRVVSKATPLMTADDDWRK
jgi:hypothetical protein